MSIRIIGIFLLAILTTNVSLADKREDQALKASIQWLSLVDEQKYDDSWETASSYFKQAVTKEKWLRAVSSVRDPLGKIITRDVKSVSYTNSLPGAPDGDYVVIQFSTSIENKKESIETVTPMLDSDGKWRVSGYYIK